MTFENAPSAINGAPFNAAMVRRATFITSSATEGISQKDDLKVSQLGTPGVGILISSGVGLALNKYQTIPNETYVVSNPGTHTVPSGEMPGSSASAKRFLVAVVVGDKDFSQVGHPFMTASDPPAGTESTFQYVRVRLIEVSAGVTTLSGSYPALVLAAIDIPSSTTTITNAMITDLRKLARPRQSQEIFVSGAGTWNNTTPTYIPSGSGYADWGNAQFAPSVKVPSWAKRAIVVCSINGVFLGNHSVDVSGAIRAQLGSVSGPTTYFNEPIGSDPIRENLQAAGTYDVTAIAGTTAILRVEGYENVPASPTTAQRMGLNTGSQMVFDVRFFEE